jgi:hypothetical protein
MAASLPADDFVPADARTEEAVAAAREADFPGSRDGRAVVAGIPDDCSAELPRVDGRSEALPMAGAPRVSAVSAVDGSPVDGSAPADCSDESRVEVDGSPPGELARDDWFPDDWFPDGSVPDDLPVAVHSVAPPEGDSLPGADWVQTDSVEPLADWLLDDRWVEPMVAGRCGPEEALADSAPDGLPQAEPVARGDSPAVPLPGDLQAVAPGGSAFDWDFPDVAVPADLEAPV